MDEVAQVTQVENQSSLVVISSDVSNLNVDTEARKISLWILEVYKIYGSIKEMKQKDWWREAKNQLVIKIKGSSHNFGNKSSPSFSSDKLEVIWHSIYHTFLSYEYITKALTNHKVGYIENLSAAKQNPKPRVHISILHHVQITIIFMCLRLTKIETLNIIEIHKLHGLRWSMDYKLMS